jgi:hypothetical protein
MLLDAKIGGNYLPRIAPVDTMVIKFGVKNQVVAF